MKDALKSLGSWVFSIFGKAAVLIFFAGGLWVSINQRIDANEERSMKNEDKINKTLTVICEMAIEIVPDKENTKRYCQR